MAAMQRKELLAALPQSWRRRLSDYRFQQIDRGMSDALTFRLHASVGADALSQGRGAGRIVRTAQ